MKDINIFENFLNDEELEEARQFIGDKLVLNPGIRKKYLQLGIIDWHFVPRDNCCKKILCHVPRDEVVGMEFTMPSAKKFILKIKNRIDKWTSLNFKLERVYLNRQVLGQDVPLHQDDSKPNVYTLLIYIGDITPENYDKAGGDLELKTKENIRIEPFTKRAVLFKGYIPHQAYAPLVHGITRISFAINFLCNSERLPFSVRYS